MKKTPVFRFAGAASLFLAALHGTAHAQFTDIGAVLTPVDLSAVAWGDFDNDGYPDILLAGYDAGFTPVAKVYRNNGDGTFTDIEAGLAGVAYSSVAWGDFNNNGLLDILLAGRDGNFNSVTKVYANNGDGTFTDIGAGLTGVRDGSVAWGDFDNDGFLDILLTGLDSNFNAVAKVYRNNGDGTFTDVEAGLAGVGFSSAVWGDFDNDGHLDILLTGEDTSFQFIAMVYANNGDGTFTAIDAGLTGVAFSSVDWADSNGDGYLEIVLTGLDNDWNAVSKVYVYDAANDTFVENADAVLAPVSDGSVAWGDYNSDGLLDILLTGYHSTGPVSRVYENNGDGAFTDLEAGLIGVSSGGAAWGDHNADGNPDILLTGFAGGNLIVARVYENDLDPIDEPEPEPEPEVTVEDLLEDLQHVVADLQDAGVLNRGNANAAATQLGNAMRSHANGNDAAACAQLGGFANMIQGQVNSRKVSPVDGAAILATVNELRGMLGCQ